MAIIARRVWLCRNIIVFGDNLTHNFQLIRSAKESVEEFHVAGLAAQRERKNVEQN